MSQIFVKKAALSGSDPILVIAMHPDEPVLPRKLYGDTLTPLTLPNSKLTIPDPRQPDSTFYYLMEDWRQEMSLMAAGEANRRISEVFPDYMQRNANADVSNSLAKYGADTATWPQDAKDRKTESDRGWNYVALVRAASDALANQTTTVDPTHDSHWPPVISPPIYIPPVSP